MYNNSIFESIKEALNTSETSGGNSMYKEILKFKAGNTYVLRLLPNINNGKDTFYHFYVNGWKSFLTGEYVSAVSLQTVGKQDPIGAELFKLKKTAVGTPEDKKKAESVKWQEQWYVNVYVVDDPVTPENNGTVKVLRFGRKLNKKIMEAVSGSDADEFGYRVFDLSENGVNFKLKVEENEGGFITYDSSRFTSPISLNLTPERQKEIYASIHNLAEINPIKSEEDLMKLWNKHFLCIDGGLPTLGNANLPPAEKEQTPVPVASESKASSIPDDMVKELLKGLEDS